MPRSLAATFLNIQGVAENRDTLGLYFLNRTLFILIFYYNKKIKTE